MAARKNSFPVLRTWMGPSIGFLLLSLLLGCTSAVTIRPPIPPAGAGRNSPESVGVYLSPNSVATVSRLSPGSGIWFGTRYSLRTGETIKDDLIALTRRHFTSSGVAASPVDKRYRYVIEYQPLSPTLQAGSLRGTAPLNLAMRDTSNGETLTEEILTGQSSAQGGRIGRFLFGRLTEREGVEASLAEAYNDLYRKVDSNLAQLAARMQVPGQ